MALQHTLNLLGDHVVTLPILVLYLTDGCNSRCLTCDIWRNPRRNMSAALFAHIVDDLQRLRTRWVVLSGGEAMQHPHWAEMAARLRAAGVRVVLLTNGLLVKKQADDVMGTVDELVVSLDAGTAQTYSAIRGVDAFDLVVDGIRAARRGGVPVVTRTTVQRANFHELPQIVEVGLTAGVNRISFLAVDVSNPFAFGSRFSAAPTLPAAPQSSGGLLTPAEVEALDVVVETLIRDYATAFAERRIAESPAKLRALVNYFRALNGDVPFTPARCNAPHTSLVVEVDGRVRPCYFLPDAAQITPGGDRLSDVLNTESVVALRHAYRTGKRSECERCVCPLYKGVRSLAKL